MRVGFSSLDWSSDRDPDGNPSPGGANWYRISMPYRELLKNDCDVVIGSDLAFTDHDEFVIRDWNGEFHAGLDVVVMQRWMHRMAPIYIRKARANGQIIINDVDDYYDGLDASNPAFIQSHPRYSSLVNRNHYRAIIAASSGVTVSTPFLAERMREVNENVIVLRNAIDLDRWKVRDVTKRAPTIGYVGATPWHSRDLAELHLGSFFDRHSEVRFFHGGDIDSEHAPKAAPILGIAADRGSTASMQPIRHYPTLFANFNIGIVPLEMRPFNEAKSFVKGLEYASSGIPFVASPTGEYLYAEKQGFGTTAKRRRAWLGALESLLDPQYRALRGAEARGAAVAQDIALRWPEWITAYEAFGAGTAISSRLASVPRSS